MISSGVYDCVIGSRILGGQARSGGMPIYKYVANRLLTVAQNLLMGSKLSEFHTGYRAFSRLGPRAASPRRELRRLCFRQPDARPDHRFRVSDRRGFLPDAILCRSFLNRPWALGDLRIRRTRHLRTLPAHQWGLRHDRLFDPNGRRITPSLGPEVPKDILESELKSLPQAIDQRVPRQKSLQTGNFPGNSSDVRRHVADRTSHRDRVVSRLTAPSVLRRAGGPDEEWYAIPGLTVAREGIPRVHTRVRRKPAACSWVRTGSCSRDAAAVVLRRLRSSSSCHQHMLPRDSPR